MIGYLIVVTLGLVILTLAGWVGFIVVIIGGVLCYWHTMKVGREQIKAFLFIAAIANEKTVAEANEYAHTTPINSLEIIEAAQKLAQLKFAGSSFAMTNAAKNMGFRP